MASILMVILVSVVGSIFFLPIYFPFLLSSLVKGRFKRWCLRGASVVSVCLYLVRPPITKYGDDVAGSMHGAAENFMWVWTIPWLCGLVGYLVAWSSKWWLRDPNGEK